jgi:ferrochelatase
MKRTVEAAPSLNLSWARSYHDEPLLIEAFAERLRPLLPAAKVLFTAHSLPEKALANGDPYERECRATASAVAARAGLDSHDFAFQSQGMTGDKWLGPTVESMLDRYSAEGVKDVVIHNIGFVCDHVEILWDIDIGFRDYAAGRSITIRRPESLNGSPTFTAALAEVARRCLA